MIRRLRISTLLAVAFVFIVVSIILNYKTVRNGQTIFLLCALAVLLSLLLWGLIQWINKLHNEISQTRKQRILTQSQLLTLSEEAELLNHARERVERYGLGGFAFLILTGLIISNASSIDGLAVLIATTAGIVLWGAAMLLYRNSLVTKLDISREKVIVKGAIKNRYWVSGGENSSGLHYITIETYTLHVKRSIYDQYEVGDRAEFHLYLPLGNYILYHKKL